MTVAVADSRTSVAALQQALNQRAAPRGYPPLDVDGILGPLTRMAVQDLGHALGIEPELLAAEQLEPEVLQLFAEPKSRLPGQVANATDRAAKLEEREIELDGVKLAWGLVKPVVRARAAGWEGSLEAVASHSELLERLFEGAKAWWHKVIEASNEGQLESILTEMGYACELVAHASGPLGRSGLRFVEQPGAVEPGAAVSGSPTSASGAPLAGTAPAPDPTAPPGPPAGTASPPDPTAPSGPSAGTASPPDPTAPSGPPPGTASPPDPTAPSAPAGTASPPAPAAPSAGAITGPDVSASQGAIDWNAVAAAGHGFAFIRATSGVSTVDPQFESNWQGAGAAGLRRGAYHVAAPQPDTDPGDEAVNLINAISAAGPPSDSDLPASAAIDDLVNARSSDQVIDWLQKFTAVFERITKQLPAIRMSADSFARALSSDASAVGGPIWLSGTAPSQQPAPATAPSQQPAPATAPDQQPAPGTPPSQQAAAVANVASFEPLAEDAECPGVTGPCGLSRFAGSQEQFDQLGGGTSPTT